MKHRIAWLPGDGIGREVMAAARLVLDRLGALDAPVPFAKALEAVFSPKGRLLPALRALLAY